jgi:hypothetical protein
VAVRTGKKPRMNFPRFVVNASPLRAMMELSMAVDARIIHRSQYVRASWR